MNTNTNTISFLFIFFLICVTHFTRTQFFYKRPAARPFPICSEFYPLYYFFLQISCIYLIIFLIYLMLIWCCTDTFFLHSHRNRYIYIIYTTILFCSTRCKISVRLFDFWKVIVSMMLFLCEIHKTLYQFGTHTAKHLTLRKCINYPFKMVNLL